MPGQDSSAALEQLRFVSEYLQATVVDRVVAAVGVPDARMRVAVISSYLVGHRHHPLPAAHRAAGVGHRRRGRRARRPDHPGAARPDAPTRLRMIRGALASLARNESLGGLISRTPIARDVVKRVVGGDTDRVGARGRARARRPRLLGEPRAHRARRRRRRTTLAQVSPRSTCGLVDAVATAGLAAVCEVSVLPEVLGGRRDPDAVPEPLAALARQAVRRGRAAHAGQRAGDRRRGVPAAGRRTSTRSALPVGITLPASRRAHRGGLRAAAATGACGLVKGGRSGDVGRRPTRSPSRSTSRSCGAPRACCGRRATRRSPRTTRGSIEILESRGAA